jgi:hypothetical protein
MLFSTRDGTHGNIYEALSISIHYFLGKRNIYQNSKIARERRDAVKYFLTWRLGH